MILSFRVLPQTHILCSCENGHFVFLQRLSSHDVTL